MLEATPDQFDLEEMGWLLNYLTSVGMGIGKQGQFLTEVIDLIKMFVRNPSRTGQSFRSKFAKYAIRECFEMLTVNSRRETHGNKEEAKAKADLTAKITELLKDCSRLFAKVIIFSVFEAPCLDCKLHASEAIVWWFTKISTAGGLAAVNARGGLGQSEQRLAKRSAKHESLEGFAAGRAHQFTPTHPDSGDMDRPRYPAGSAAARPGSTA